MKLIEKFIFLFFTIYLLIPYCIAINEKIQRPEFKNLSTKEFIYLGLILNILITINIYWLVSFYKKKK